MTGAVERGDELCIDGGRNRIADAAQGHRCPQAIGIGDGTFVVGSILDKNCRIGRNARIVNEQGLENSGGDADDCVIRDGIPIVLKDAAIPDGWRLGG